jgi:hypothetical protein
VTRGARDPSRSAYRRIEVATRRERSAAKKTAGKKKAGAKKAGTKKAGKKKAGRKKAGRKKSPERDTSPAGTPRPSRQRDGHRDEQRANHPATIARTYPTQIGAVTHYYATAGAAVVELNTGELHRGDAIHVRGHTTDFYARVEEIKVDDAVVEAARTGQTIGIVVPHAVREGDGVYLLSD